MGELATPRWVSSQTTKKKDWDGKGEVVLEETEFEAVPEREIVSSPWAIEAFDVDRNGEEDDVRISFFHSLTVVNWKLLRRSSLLLLLPSRALR